MIRVASDGPLLQAVRINAPTKIAHPTRAAYLSLFNRITVDITL
jgi:hypothetical protein